MPNPTAIVLRYKNLIPKIVPQTPQSLNEEISGHLEEAVI
jgi:hypothetical protein